MKYILILLLLPSLALAEKIEIKNPCAKWVYGDPAGWPCYNRTQGMSDAEKLEIWAEVRGKIKKQRLQMPRKVILTDILTRSGKRQRPSYVNGVLIFPVFGCPAEKEAALEVLGKKI